MMSQSDNFQSVNSQSAISSSSTEHGVLCDCNRKAKIERAWTRENPGRRFFGCNGRRVRNGYENCNFFRWFDVEKPHGWQHLALLAARDIIREQKEELAVLRNKVIIPNHEGSNMDISNEFVEKFKEKVEECEALKKEVLILGERSAVFRNVLVASSVGFAILLGGMIVMSKY